LCVVYAQITVRIYRYGVGHDSCYLLGHDTNIDRIAPQVAVAVETDAIVETAEQSDVALEADI
jgi:hypothetical protein